MRFPFLPLLALCMVAGCSKDAPVVQRPVSESNPAKNDSPKAPEGPVTLIPKAPKADPKDPAKEPDKPVDANSAMMTPKKLEPLPVKVPAPGTQGWTKTSMSLNVLGQRIEGAMLNLRNARARLSTIAQTSEGQGTYEQEVAIQDRKNYKIDFLVIDKKPVSGTDVANGKDRMVRVDATWTKPMEVGKPLDVVNRSPSQLASIWISDFSRMAFQGLTDGKGAWSQVFDSWSKGFEGFKPTVEERHMKYQGVNVTSFRIRAERSGSAVSTYGPCKIEIVVDGRHFLPVTVRVERKDKEGKPWLTQWSAQWRFKQNLASSDFKMPLGG